jgi:hypothetical protein
MGLKHEEGEDVGTKTCELRSANGMPGVDCDEGACIYWRVVGHVGVAEYAEGCAVQYFEPSNQSPEIAEWLMGVKERVESHDADRMS